MYRPPVRGAPTTGTGFCFFERRWTPSRISGTPRMVRTREFWYDVVKEKYHGDQSAIEKLNETLLKVQAHFAGAALILNSAQTEATPNKVTASKPCGSCHPPNKPPRR